MLLFAYSTQSQIVTEFSSGISANAYLYGITAGPDGNIWFTEYSGSRIGRITPTGVVTEFKLSALQYPTSITAGPDGNLWFIESGYNGWNPNIGRITPTGVVTEFSLGGGTPSPSGIVAGPDGNLWITLFDYIARMTTNGVESFVPILHSFEFPRCITAGPDGNLWYTLGASGFRSTIARMTPAGVITEFSTGIDSGGGYPCIVAGPDGNLWFTGYNDNLIGRITPAGVVTRFSAGISANAYPYSITAGPDGNLWFTEPGANKIGRITPSGVVTEFSTGISAGAGPTGITAGPDGNIWFTEQGVNRIGRITIAGSATTTTSPTTIFPGSLSSPGSTLSALTPQFSWNAAVGATGYGLYIRDITTNTLVYPNAAGTTNTPLTGTSYQLPSGYLVNGHAYRWAMTSFNSSKESSQSGYLYFQTPVVDTAADCLFNWAEKNYASLFSPATTSQTVSPYYFRYYSTTKTYLGTSSSDRHFYYVGVDAQYDLGLVSTWYSTASCTQPQAAETLLPPAIGGTLNQVTCCYQKVATTTLVSAPQPPTWGLTASGFTSGVTTPFAPIDTMTIYVKGVAKTLSAYANVNNDGTKNSDGPFQCTALVAQYLSLLGFTSPIGLHNGQYVVSPNITDPNDIRFDWDLATGPNSRYFDSSPSSPPRVGSIVSMASDDPKVGHVAIVKGVTQQDANNIVVTLIEDNMTLKSDNWYTVNGLLAGSFAINRQMRFIKAGGIWSSSYADGCSDCTGSFSVIGWATPLALPQ